MHLFGHNLDHDYYFELPRAERRTRLVLRPRADKSNPECNEDRTAVGDMKALLGQVAGRVQSFVSALPPDTGELGSTAEQCAGQCSAQSR
jgi:hypothetical protein